jgi:hypothetical protein
MLNTRWLIGFILAASATLPACNTKTSLGRDGTDAGRQDGSVQPGIKCTWEPTQLDVSCNEDRNLDLSSGTCQADGTCSCNSGFVLNPTSNRCRLAVDAAVVTCIVGDDKTCDDAKVIGSGTCLEKGCACNAGFVINPATGRCRLAPATDAGAKTDSGAGNVCTPSLNQTCNDDDLFSGVAGFCTPSGTCACNSGFVINPATSRCRASAKLDAGVTPDTWVGKDTVADVVDARSVGKDLGKDSPGVCTYGMDQTCNDDGWASWVAGACQSNGTCICDTGYVLNPSSGRCAYAPRDASPDITPDARSVCTPGMNQTCNDDPISAAVSGVCQANGTCSCNDGYSKNAITGKCMRPEVSTCSGSYTACGCGCCTGPTPTPVCYYPSAGESVSTVRTADEAAKSGANCAMAGCALGQHYLCCGEATPEPSGSATYSAAYHIGGYDRIILDKTGTDGNCVSLGLIYALSGSSSHPMRLTTPANWSVEGTISAGACKSPSPEQSIGAQGTVTFTPNGSSCTISAHLTAFFYSDATGAISTMRIDTDNTSITGGGPSGYCK